MPPIFFSLTGVANLLFLIDAYQDDNKAGLIIHSLGLFGALVGFISALEKERRLKAQKDLEREDDEYTE